LLREIEELIVDEARNRHLDPVLTRPDASGTGVDPAPVIRTDGRPLIDRLKDPVVTPCFATVTETARIELARERLGTGTGDVTGEELPKEVGLGRIDLQLVLGFAAGS